MNLSKGNKYIKWAILISLLNFVLRLLVGSFTNLGNDEVYYRVFALYPDWSHFDHAPMVGWLIQLTTFNLYFSHEFFFRIGPLLFSVLNLFLLFKFVEKISDQKAAFLAVVLYSVSFYASIVSGLFIMPDSPMLTFWLLGLFYFYAALIHKNPNRKFNTDILLAGFFTGLSMLSKYHGVFLWFSAGFFILFYRRFWLKKPELYMAIILSFIVFSPVLWWNIQNDFISFTFHGNRVSVLENGIHLQYFAQELLGQIGYNNPFLWLIFVLSIIYFKRTFSDKDHDKGIFFLWFSLPLILLFLFVSLFRFTLPHWSGPAFVTAIIPASIYLTRNWGKTQKRFIITATILYFSVILISFIHIKTGFFLPEGQMKNDPSSELAGWKDLNKSFSQIRKLHLESEIINENHFMLSNKWFPAAHIDMYLASPNNLKLYVYGDLEQTHKFAWINDYRGDIKKGCDAYFITSNTSFRDPNESLSNYFQQILPPDTVVLTRFSKPYRTHYIYILKNYNGNNFFEKAPHIK